MECKKPIRITKNLDRKTYPDGLKVPCGSCLACRIARKKEWSIRMLHEVSYYPNSIFITLTYDEKHVPENKSLRKKDFQSFMKVLRKNVYPRKIRYYACGEYGDETYRPHYHAIIFNVDITEKHLIYETWKKCDWEAKVKTKNGWTTLKEMCVGLAQPDSIAYVAKYITKQLNGEMALKEYTEKGREPVFKVASLGLGKQWAYDNKAQIIQDKCIKMYGVKHAIPRQYLKWLELDTEEFKKLAEKKECELVDYYTGVKMSEDEYYKSATAKEYRRYDKKVKQAKTQHDKNLQRNIDNKHSNKM